MVQLKVPPEEAIRLLSERVDALSSVQATGSGPDYYDLVRWCSKTYEAVDCIYAPGEPHPDDIRNMALQNCSCSCNIEAAILMEAYRAKIGDYIRQIRDLAGSAR